MSSIPQNRSDEKALVDCVQRFFSKHHVGGLLARCNGMKKFPGVLLFSSRDHQIVETTANRIMEILPGGKMIDKITTYDEYLASDATAAKRQAILDLNTEEQDD